MNLREKQNFEDLEKYVKENYNKLTIVDWSCISAYQQLSESFIEKYQDKVDWFNISAYQQLSESFIEKFKDEVYWSYISYYQQLSEQFIEKYQDKLDWKYISHYQQLSEPFIDKFQDEVDWFNISRYQQLSEPFIDKFQDKVHWLRISGYQQLSEPFIDKFQDKLDWYFISSCQKLSEPFIDKFQNKVDWYAISIYQKLSPEFREKHNIKVSKYSWLYKTKEEKLQYLKSNNCPYEIINDEYVIAYKSCREDGYSVFNFQYHYEVGKTYEAHCDCNQDNHNSFGLSAWTKEKALEYYSKGKLFLVKIDIDNIGTIITDHKIRAKKLTVLEEVEKD